jgi:hypothetical protein
MEIYARDRLSYFLVEPGREHLVQVVVGRSRGIFRRVVVAVMSLRRLQSNGCAIFNLEQELNSLPDGIGADDQETENEDIVPARCAKVPANMVSFPRPQAGSPSAVWSRGVPSSPGGSSTFEHEPDDFEREPGDMDRSQGRAFMIGKPFLAV